MARLTNLDVIDSKGASWCGRDPMCVRVPRRADVLAHFWLVDQGMHKVPVDDVELSDEVFAYAERRAAEKGVPLSAWLAATLHGQLWQMEFYDAVHRDVGKARAGLDRARDDAPRRGLG